MKALLALIVIIVLACLLFLFMKPGEAPAPAAAPVAAPVAAPAAAPVQAVAPVPPPPVTVKPAAPPPAAASPTPGSVGSVLDYATGYTALKVRKRSGEKINNISADLNKRIEEEAAK